MTTINLRKRDGKIAFISPSIDMTRALELAYKNNQIIDNIDINSHNLSHITLDGATFKNVTFFNCDLNDANLSECVFENCNFTYCDLNDACLCYSDFKECIFNNNTYNKTDIAEASFVNCQFIGKLYKWNKLCRPYKIINCRRYNTPSSILNL